MKYQLIIIFLLLISTVSAQDILINPLKQDYHPGETFQAEINLSSEPQESFRNSHLKFIDNLNQTAQIGLILKEIDKNYFFVYTDFPMELSEGEYKLKVENLRYIINNTLMEISEQEKFNIKTEDIPIISISPSYIILDKDFNIELKNNALTEANISVEITSDIITPSRSTITIPSNTLRRLFFNINEIPNEDKKIDIILSYSGTQYRIPIFYFQEEIINTTQEKKITIIPLTNKIEFLTSLDQLNKTLKKDFSLSGSLDFKNTGSSDLHDLNFELTGNLNQVINLNLTSLDILKQDQTETQFIWVNQNKDALLGNYLGELILTTKEDASVSFPIHITISQELIQNETEQHQDINLTEEHPKEEIIPQPTKKEKIKTSRIILLILIILIILLIISYFYLKNKQSIQT